MTPEQTAAAEVVTADLQAYSDQFVPGATQAMGRFASTPATPPRGRMSF